MNHTPGPWIAQPDKDSLGGWAIGVKGKAIDEIAVCDERNARLIAAAPDLLAALQEVVDAADADGWNQLDATLKKQRAAIAKATGETK